MVDPSRIARVRGSMATLRPSEVVGKRVWLTRVTMVSICEIGACNTPTKLVARYQDTSHGQSSGGEVVKYVCPRHAAYLEQTHEAEITEEA